MGQNSENVETQIERIPFKLFCSTHGYWNWFKLDLMKYIIIFLKVINQSKLFSQKNNNNSLTNSLQS